MENLLRQQLFGDPETPSAGIGGTAQNDKMDPVGVKFHEAEFHIPPPGTAAPVRKSLSIDEVERQLAERRKARRASLVAANPEFCAEARERIKSFCNENRDAIRAAGSFEKLFQ